MQPPLAPPGLTVWIVEDHDLYRRTLATLIDEAPDMRCALAAATFEEALAALEADAPPDIVLMDIGLPGLSGIEGARLLRARSPISRVVMLTVHEEDDKIFDALCAGASGYLLKPASPERVVEAVREVQQGAAPINPYIARKMLALFGRLTTARNDYGLTDREKAILQLLVEGLTMPQIAAHLFLSYHTINSHVRNIYDKLHVHSRGSAVAKALKERLI